MSSIEKTEGRVDPEIIPSEELSGREALTRDVFLNFADLPENFRQNILDEIKKLQSSGASLTEVIERTKSLIKNSQQLIDISNSETDPEEDLDFKEIGTLDNFIEKMEKLSRRKETIH